MRQLDQLKIFMAGFLTALTIVCVLATILLCTESELQDYLPEFKPKIQYVDIGNDVPQIKLYLKMRLTPAGYSSLLDYGCLEEIVDKLQYREAAWETEYCYNTYSHLLYEFDDRFGKITVLTNFWRKQ